MHLQPFSFLCRHCLLSHILTPKQQQQKYSFATLHETNLNFCISKNKTKQNKTKQNKTKQKQKQKQKQRQTKQKKKKKNVVNKRRTILKIKNYFASFNILPSLASALP